MEDQLAFCIALLIALPLVAFLMGFVSEYFSLFGRSLRGSLKFGLRLAGFALLFEGVIVVFVLLIYGLMLIIQGAF